MPAGDNRFLCPHCQQKLACEDGYAGWQIQCPACQRPVTVPLPILPVAASPPPRPASDVRQESGSRRTVRWLKRSLGVLACAAVGACVTAGFSYGFCSLGIKGLGGFVRIRLSGHNEYEGIIFGVVVFLMLLKVMVESQTD